MVLNIVSQSVTTGYNSRIHTGYKAGVELVNLHSDTANLTNEIPMQGPFAETWVGGHQSRHTELTKYDLTLRDDENQVAPANKLHNLYTRPEAYRLLVVEQGGSSDGALGLADPQYGQTKAAGHPMHNKYPDINKKSAVYFREERTKRPVNIANRETSLTSNRLGNYKENYEVISVASGKYNNNMFFRDNESVHTYIHRSIGSVLPATTQNQSLFGFNPKANGNVFGAGESNLFNPTTEASVNLYTTLAFDLVTSGSLEHEAVLNITADTDILKVIVADPNLPINTGSFDLSTIDHIIYTGSNGFAFKANANQQILDNNSYSGLNSETGFSISFWLNRTTIDDLSPSSWIQLRNSTTTVVQINLRTSGDVQVYLADQNTNSDTETYSKLVDGENTWSHYIFTVDTSDMAHATPANRVADITIFKNGTQVSASTATSYDSFPSVYNSLRVALDDTLAMQDLIIWKKTLSSTDASRLYNDNIWLNPTSISASQINDWYKFGYEPDFLGLDVGEGDTLDSLSLAPYILSSSYPTNGSEHHLTIQDPTDTLFHIGKNPFSDTARTDTQIRAELETILDNKFTTNFGGSSYVGSNGATATFTIQSASFGPYTDTLTATEISSSFSNITITQGSLHFSDVGQNVVEVVSEESPNKSIITSRFSAPGGIETMTYGFLDAYNQEMSAYNAMTYRNLLVRGSGSGEVGTIRLDDHLGNRHGLLTHLSRHSGKFGADSVYGTVTAGSYVTKPSYHKIPRNTSRKPASDSSLVSPTFNFDHDNFFVRSTLPRSDFQYAWITSSLGSNYSINSGKQRLFGYSPRNGIMSSSYEVHGESGYVGAITFPTASELFGE